MQKGVKVTSAEIFIFVEVVIAAATAIIIVTFYVHRSTNKIINRLEDTKLRVALEHNSEVLVDVKRELEILTKQLAALNDR